MSRINFHSNHVVISILQIFLRFYQLKSIWLSIQQAEFVRGYHQRGAWLEKNLPHCVILFQISAGGQKGHLSGVRERTEMPSSDSGDENGEEPDLTILSVYKRLVISYYIHKGCFWALESVELFHSEIERGHRFQESDIQVIGAESRVNFCDIWAFLMFHQRTECGSGITCA